MKFDTEIKDFLKKYINIDKKRLDNARSKTARSIDEEEKWTLVKFLQNNIDQKYFDSTAYQWSMSYYTVIKPHPDNEDGQYDVDVAIKLKYNSDRDGNEKEYYNLVYNCLKNSDRYKDKVGKEKERSVRVNYDSDDGEFYVDLVPMFQINNERYVVDHKSNTKEISWGFLFRNWINEQNNKTSIEWSQEKFLKKIIRIYKFFRNEWHISHIKSVQITLLLTRQIDKLNQECFWDISLSLYHISKELKAEIETCETISDLDLSNPQLPEEIFNRWLNDEQFLQFKESLIEHIDRIISAYDEEDQSKSLELRQWVFWDWFSSSIQKNYTLVTFNHAENPIHRWLTYSNNLQKINIKCKYKFLRDKKWKWYSYQAHGKKLSSSTDLRFYTTNVPKTIQWTILRQVTNNSLAINKRWEINKPSKDLWYQDWLWWFAIKENTEYRWQHYVQCRLINNQNIIIAESDKFFIKIM